MAIDFAALSNFKVYDSAYSTSIVHVKVSGDSVTLAHGGMRSNEEWRTRSSDAKEANNQARAQFLAALGRAAGLVVSAGEDGRYSFGDDFFANLKSQLGDKAYKALNVGSGTFKRDAAGHLISGKPLTERRISRIYDALIKKANLEGANQTTAEGLGLRSLDAVITDQHTEDFRKMNGILQMEDPVGAVRNCLYREMRFGTSDLNAIQQTIRAGGVQVVLQGFNSVINDLFGKEKNWGETVTDGARLESSMQDLVAWMDLLVSLRPNQPKRTFEAKAVLEGIFKNVSGEPAVPDEPPVLPTVTEATPASERLFANAVQMLMRLPSYGVIDFLRKRLEKAEKDGNAMSLFSGLKAVFGEHAVAPDGNQLKALNLAMAVALKKYGSGKLFGPNEDVLIWNAAKALRSGVSEVFKSKKPTSVDDLIRGLKDLQPVLKQFGDDESLKLILVSALFAPRHDESVKGMLNDDVLSVGGGLGSANRYEFKVEGQSYVSTTRPQKSVEHQHGVFVKAQRSQPTGLSFSSLSTGKDADEKPLVSFLRFGCVATTGKNRKSHYEQLVVQAFLNNPALLAQAKNGGSITVPLARIDLADNNNLIEDKESRKPISFTFSKTGEEPPISVMLVPQVRHFHVPTDSFHLEPKEREAVRNGRKPIETVTSNLNLMPKEHLTRTLRAVADLLSDADTYLTTNTVLEDRRVIEALKRQVSEYRDELNEKVKDGAIKWFANCGPEMQRFGARIALLAAKIGQMPAVNCNWGRDRTGAMDNEIKMLALQLARDPAKLGPIILKKDEADPDIALRTSLLKQTGNCDIARQVNFTTYPINLNQTLVAGFDTLFDLESLKKADL